MPKAQETTVSAVRGGNVARSTSSGRFVEVRSNGKTNRASEETYKTVKEASSRRSAALKRLADR